MTHARHLTSMPGFNPDPSQSYSEANIVCLPCAPGSRLVIDVHKDCELTIDFEGKLHVRPKPKGGHPLGAALLLAAVAVSLGAAGCAALWACRLRR